MAVDGRAPGEAAGRSRTVTVKGVCVRDEHTAAAFLDVATLPHDALSEVYRELIAALSR